MVSETENDSTIVHSIAYISKLFLVLLENVFADFVGGSLAEAGHARSKEPEGT